MIRRAVGVDDLPSKNFSNPEINRLAQEDRVVHDWYRFVLSYPAHLVREYMADFGVAPGSVLLDPFCGTGTTLVEAKKSGVECVGVEAHPMAHFAARSKLRWDVDPDGLRAALSEVYSASSASLAKSGISDDPQLRMVMEGDGHLLKLDPEQHSLLLKNSICPLPLHKALVLRGKIDNLGGEFRDLMRLALAKELVTSIGNLHFGPEVGVSKPKQDVAVLGNWYDRVSAFASDLEVVRKLSDTKAEVINEDSRVISTVLPPQSIDFVITSPPYPNEKDYTRTTRLESVLLGFISSKADLRSIKEGRLLRSNTRNVYKGDTDDDWIASNSGIQEIAAEIEKRRVEMGKTSGFERLYHRVAKLYFGGMARHFAEMRRVLKPGARLAYVVGDQASYLRVMIRTGEILGQIAEDLGYELERIDLFRTRLATATREQLREEVVVLRWRG